MNENNDSLDHEWVETPSKVDVTTAGFTVHAKDGGYLAYRECVVDALQAMKGIHEAEYVLKVSSGALIATKHRIREGSLLAALVKQMGEAA